MLVAAGPSHHLVLLEGCDLYAWGQNAHGQVGDGTDTQPARPVRVLQQVSLIAVGFNHSMALVGQPGWHSICFTWGCNGSGQLGDGTKRSSHRPVKVNMELPIFEIAAGGDHCLVVTKLDWEEFTHCYAWGANVSRGTTTSCNITAQSEVACLPEKVLENVRTVTGGRNHSLAILCTGDCVAWGRNTHGQLGCGNTHSRLDPGKVLNIERVRTVSAGLDYNLAVLETGECFAWGCNVSGRLGDGTTLDRLTPVKILERVRAVAAGVGHSLAVLENNECLGWGINLHNCVSVDRRVEFTEPVRVLGNVRDVGIGGYLSRAVSMNGDHYLWGQDCNAHVASMLECGIETWLCRTTCDVFRMEDAHFDPEPSGEALGLGGRAEGEGSAAAGEGQSDDEHSQVDGEVVDADTVAPELPRSPPLGTSGAARRLLSRSSRVFTADSAGSGPRKSDSRGSSKSAKQVTPDEVRRQVHAKARVAARAYTIRWVAFRRRAPPPTRANIKSIPQDDGEVLQAFLAELVGEIARFDEDDAKIGGAFKNGWSPEDCDTITGLPALKDTLAAAIATATGRELPLAVLCARHDDHM